MDDRTPLGLRRLMALELDASSIAVRLWGLNGDSAYITRYTQSQLKSLMPSMCLYCIVDLAEHE